MGHHGGGGFGGGGHHHHHGGNGFGGGPHHHRPEGPWGPRRGYWGGGDRWGGWGGGWGWRGRPFYRRERGCLGCIPCLGMTFLLLFGTLAVTAGSLALLFKIV